ncbi:MAG: hypothetical protein Q7S84_03110 [bacterium]|nr:hypothetical protein [bacterium]
MKDLQKISKRTGIPAVFFKEMLGIPLKPCSARTIKEAWDAYENAQRGTEEKQAALAKWNELSLKNIKAAKTFNEALAAYEHTLCDGENFKKALRKIYNLF